MRYSFILFLWLFASHAWCQNNSIFSGGIGAGGANALTEEGVTNNSVFGGGTGGDGVVQELDYFGGGTNEALPVELLSFEAICTDEGLNVQWATVTEVNSEEFVLYRKHALEAPFEKIAIIPAAGFSVTVRHYEVLDKCSNCQEAYYYLKMVDFDGSWERSDILQKSCEPQNEIATKDHMLVWTEGNAESLLSYLKNESIEFLIGVDGKTWPIQEVSFWHLNTGVFMAQTTTNPSFKIAVLKN